PVLTAVHQADRVDAQGTGDAVPLADAVLALRVQDAERAITKAQLPQHVALLERRLAEAGLAEHERVTAGKALAGGGIVEDERVVDVCLAGVNLPADDHATRVRGRRTDRGVEPGRGCGGGAQGAPSGLRLAA